MGVACDVSKPADVERLAARAAEELGQIDIWVCNAAMSPKAKRHVAQCSAGEMQVPAGMDCRRPLGGRLSC